MNDRYVDHDEDMYSWRSDYNAEPEENDIEAFKEARDFEESLDIHPYICYAADLEKDLPQWEAEMAKQEEQRKEEYIESCTKWLADLYGSSK